MYAIYKDNELLALAEELTFFVRDADGTNLAAEPEAAQGVVYNGVTYHIEGRPEISGAETVSLAQISTDGAPSRPEDLKQNGVNFGRRGENLARVLRIDVSDMLEAYPGATIKALAQRPRENVAYVAESAVKDGVLYWPLTQVDTGIVGDGLAEVRALVGDVLAKSVLLRTHIDPSLTAPEDSAAPPEPAKGWLQQAIEAAEKAQAAQTAAESSATAAAASATAAGLPPRGGSGLKFDPREEYPAWSRPICAEDSYSIGDKCSYGGKKWVSTCNGNCWVPGVMGWDEVTE